MLCPVKASQVLSSFSVLCTADLISLAQKKNGLRTIILFPNNAPLQSTRPCGRTKLFFTTPMTSWQRDGGDLSHYISTHAVQAYTGLWWRWYVPSQKWPILHLLIAIPTDFYCPHFPCGHQSYWSPSAWLPMPALAVWTQALTTNALTAAGDVTAIIFMTKKTKLT